MNFALLVITGLVAVTSAAKLEEKFAWNQMTFAWPSPQTEQDAINSGRYIPGNNLILGLEVWKDKLFVTVPRWKAGVASSLNYIQLPTDEKSPILRPYPNWEANVLPIEIDNSTPSITTGGRTDAARPVKSGEGIKDNSTIISTFRVQADACDRLWVMDTGLNDILGKPNQIAPPAIVIFDLNTDQLIRRFTLPESDVKDETFFANIVVDVTRDNCDNAYAYIPDLGAYGIVVYSFKDNKSWRIKHNFFHFDPLNGDYNVGGVNFQWTDGVFALAIGSQQPDGSKPVYFHALSSTKEFVVPNTVLQNETYVTGQDNYYAFQLLGDRGRNGQASAEVFDPLTGTLFYTQVNKDAIACWNTQKPYTPDNQGLVDSDSTALEFPNDLKLDDRGNLWVLSDRLPAFIYRSLQPREINYRILVGRTDDLISGTPCQSQQFQPQQFQPQQFQPQPQQFQPQPQQFQPQPQQFQPHPQPL